MRSLYLYRITVLLCGIINLSMALDRGWEIEPECDEQQELPGYVFHPPFLRSQHIPSVQFYRKDAFPGEGPYLLQGQQLKYNHATRESMRINNLNYYAKPDHPTETRLPILRTQKWIEPLMLDVNGRGQKRWFIESWYVIIFQYSDASGKLPNRRVFKLNGDWQWLKGCVANGDNDAIKFDYEYWYRKW